MGKDSPSPAPPRDLAKEIQQILSQGPALQASDQTLGPQSVLNDLSNLQLALYGSPGGPRTVSTNVPEQGWINTQTGQFTTTDPSANGIFPGKQQQGSTTGRGANSQPLWMPYTRQATQTTTQDMPAQRGFLSMYQDASGTARDLTSANRTATYSDLRRLNPGQASIYDLLNADAEAGLKAGDRLTGDQTYNIVNPVRSDWARRGLGTAAPAQLDESLQLFAGGNALGQQRRANAASTAELGSKLYTNPAAALSTQVDPMSLLGAAGGYGKQPNILQQLGGYGSDLFNTNFNATSANNINQANANNANTQAAVGTAIALASLFCWAAREVFGAHDPKWKDFRHWMLTLAPLKFRAWYLRHGPEWAERLAANPPVKAIVRRWMERKILEVHHGL